MNVFDNYSQFYDLLYVEKDYNSECDFIEVLWKKHSKNKIHTVLDLGCGTGGHALPLIQRGYKVTGVDRSNKMLGYAKQKATSLGVETRWICHDIQTLRINQTFDAVISMFAVIGYQTTNDDISAAFQTARLHLNPGGLFIFDVWFGPAVLTDLPTDRVKIIDLDEARLIRFSQPELNLLKNIVKVNYTLIHLRGDSVLRQVNEEHLVRYYFPQELSYFLSQNGFQVQGFCPFLYPDGDITSSHFNLTTIAEAI